MAVVTTYPPTSTRTTLHISAWRRTTWLAIIAALTLATFLIHGYHPFADDGGLYAAGVEHLLDTNLFPHDLPFVTEHLHFSLFAPAVATFVRTTHLSLASSLLLLYLFTIALTSFAAHKILQRCTLPEPAQLAALGLLCTFWTLPIAGTSLTLTDPYLTARSFSTPLALLAIAFALPSPASHSNPRRSALLALTCLSLAACAHPLMAAYAVAFVITLTLTRFYPIRFISIFLLCAAVASATTLTAFAPPESPAAIAAQLSRTYWFLSQWRWFELLGLFAPLALFLLLLHDNRRRTTIPLDPITSLCQASLITGSIAIFIAAAFAHENASTHLVARLQPLRSFLLPYAIMTLLLGASLAQLIHNATRTTSSIQRTLLKLLPTLTLLSSATIFFTVQRRTYPASSHIEFPTRPSSNPWVNAFFWARDNTPTNALFALDANYIETPGEDTQTFRAIALRSSVPDFFKDGGEAAITPSLAPLWQQGVTAQTHLSTESDALRATRLLPLNVTWMLLHSTAKTSYPCPYDNGTVKVCQLFTEPAPSPLHEK